MGEKKKFCRGDESGIEYSDDAFGGKLGSLLIMEGNYSDFAKKEMLKNLIEITQYKYNSALKNCETCRSTNEYLLNFLPVTTAIAGIVMWFGEYETDQTKKGIAESTCTQLTSLIYNKLANPTWSNKGRDQH